MSDAKFSVDYSKRTSNCKKCKKQLPKNALRLAKHVFNHFSGDGDEMKTYFHVDCLFDTFKRAKATTKIIESTDDIKEFKNIQEVDKKTILKLIKEIEKVRTNKKTSNSKQKASNKSNENSRSDKNLKKDENSEAEGHNDPKDDPKDDPEENPTDKEDDPDKDDENNNKDDSVKFDEFQDVCSDISNQSGKAKTQVLRKFLENLSKASQVYKFLKLLLPSVCNRVYNLNSKQLVKLFSRIFDVDLDDMTDHLNQGDVAQTIREYFAKSVNVKPAKTSTLTLNEVDDYLDKLTKITKEQDQYNLLKQITKKCTKNDLRTFVRLIKKDLRLDAGSKLILDAISPNAYAAFQVSRDLKDVVERTFALKKHNHKAVLKKDLSIRVSLMTPIKPMLAEACKSVDIAFKKCKNGIYAETKYDGERLQIHKNGNQFRYFSRNLKEVQPHKVAHLKEFIPKSIPNANQLILDGEVLLYDHITKKPLPFGTLGVHKKNQFKDATVCLYVFDCLYLNGRDLMNEPFDERRKILEQNMKEIPGRIMLSEQTFVTNPKDLRKLMMKAINEGLEGLVLKDAKSIYEPGMRHWLKMKKDYLDEGTMADTADLVVLGAYYGTGNYGGMKSTFLMGTLNEKTNKWHTVTKCANGLDDKTLAKLQKQIDMIEIKRNAALVPDWLVVNKSLIPDFVVKDPKKSPVWELTGAEFSQSDIHTADGISIRFPRVTKFRDDKSWQEATNLDRLKMLYKLSKEKSNILDEDKNNVAAINQKPAKRTSEESNLDAKSPKKQKSKAKESSDDEDDQFPPLFQNKKFYLASDLENVQKLKRHLIAYHGTVLSDDLKSDTTHLVVKDKNCQIEPDLADAVIITDKQLWQCIRSKKKLI